jgi:hypothetical protein
MYAPNTLFKIAEWKFSTCMPIFFSFDPPPPTHTHISVLAKFLRLFFAVRTLLLPSQLFPEEYHVSVFRLFIAELKHRFVFLFCWVSIKRTLLVDNSFHTSWKYLIAQLIIQISALFKIIRSWAGHLITNKILLLDQFIHTEIRRVTAIIVNLLPVDSLHEHEVVCGRNCLPHLKYNGMFCLDWG